MLLIPFLGFSQFEAGEFINADTAKITNSAIIYPHADSVDQYYYSKMRDPSEPLDGVNLRTLFSRLANLDSLGLLVTDLVSGHQEINTGETQIYFPSAFDSNDVVVVPFVRRISDDAVIDYLINDVDSLGFDIVVWEDNVKLYYVASQNISHSSDIFGEPIYSADSSYIKTFIRSFGEFPISSGMDYLVAGLNTISIPNQVDTDFNVLCNAYDENDNEMGYKIIWSTLDSNFFQIWVNSPCILEWSILDNNTDIGNINAGGIIDLTAGINTITVPEQGVDYNPLCNAYNSGGDEVGFKIIWSTITPTSFQVWVNDTCKLRWSTIKNS